MRERGGGKGVVGSEGGGVRREERSGEVREERGADVCTQKREGWRGSDEYLRTYVRTNKRGETGRSCEPVQEAGRARTRETSQKNKHVSEPKRHTRTHARRLRRGGGWMDG